MRRYPDVAHLAEADLDSVLKMWEGLGYYSRARNLHRGARYLIDTQAGQVPGSYSELLLVPGIGPYTAAAIASFAYAEAVPLLDGNVIRVMARLNRIQGEVSRSATKQEIRDRLSELIPLDDPSAFNQGLMDLGRVICIPREPKCHLCPLAFACESMKHGDQDQFPVKQQKKPLPHYTIVIGLIRKSDRVLIQKRKTDGLLGGLWEFPGGKVETGETLEDAIRREISEETGLAVVVKQKIATIDHAYTHFKITMTAFFCDWQAGQAQTHAATENRWVKMTELSAFAFPKANLKILGQLTSQASAS